MNNICIMKNYIAKMFIMKKNKLNNCVCIKKIIIVILTCYVLKYIFPFTIIGLFRFNIIGYNFYDESISVSKGGTHRIVLLSFNNDLEYSSENDEIAQVNWLGVVKGNNKGTTYILIVENGKVYRCKVIVE